jgi:hypothetical protein
MYICSFEFVYIHIHRKSSDNFEHFQCRIQGTNQRSRIKVRSVPREPVICYHEISAVKIAGQMDGIDLFGRFIGFKL